MTSDDATTTRARRIRICVIMAVVWIVFAVAFATVGSMTDLDGFAGTTMGVIMSLFFAVSAVVLARRQRRRL